MKIENLVLEDGIWNSQSKDENIKNVDLVTIFGEREEFSNQEHFEYMRVKYPSAIIVGCSSSGNILGSEVSKYKVIASAVSFDKAHVVLNSVEVKEEDNVLEVSKELASAFDTNGLKHIFLLVDGLTINGSDVIDGFNEILKDIPKTGGMAADGAEVEKTFICANDIPKQRIISAVGFYGESLEIGYGTQGGWSGFGTVKTITKSEGNILYEVDGEPILDYYKRYLDMNSSDMQKVGFKYPLSVKKDESDIGVVRTMIIINDEDKSIVFAGSVPQGNTVQLMKPNMKKLISGAGDAAIEAKIDIDAQAFALVVSCEGRRAVMGDIIDEEIEAVSEELGDNVHLTGFYSYGELAPLKTDLSNCILHNETMTMTVIYEK